MGQGELGGQSPRPTRVAEYSVDLRMWAGSYQALALEAQPQGYRLWKSKARGYLRGKFPQIGQLLGWAEKQLEPVGAGSQQT
eukprot:9024840-Alexandrium_andersonii.AAC.1